MTSETDFISLADFRRSVAEMYARVRQADLPPVERWQRFRRERDRLFAAHSQSALTAEQKAAFQSLRYFDYDPWLRFALPVEPVPVSEPWEVDLPAEGRMRFRRFGKVHLPLGEQPAELSLFWIDSYGGGIFLPFRDGTNSQETYGGGRYLLDTIKGADLGTEDGKLVVDFNFAYNPSCAYSPQWTCPLAPAENVLSFRVEAGEKALDLPEASC